MNKRTVIILDSDAIIAQANPLDVHHKKTLEILQFLSSTNANVFCSTSTVLEAVTHIQRVLSSGKISIETATSLLNTRSKIIDVTNSTLELALKYFITNSSKKNTLFDCVVLAIAKEKKADAIFSFDRFYTKHGFRLAEDLLEKK